MPANRSVEKGYESEYGDFHFEVEYSVKRIPVFILSLLFLYGGVVSAMEDCLSFEKHAFLDSFHHASAGDSHSHPETPFKADPSELHCLKISLASQPFARLSAASEVRSYFAAVRLIQECGLSSAPSAWWSLDLLVKPPDIISRYPFLIGILPDHFSAVLRI